MLRKIAAVLAIAVVISLLVGPLAKFDNGSPASVRAPGGDTLVARVNQAAANGGGNPPVDGVTRIGAQLGKAVKPIDQPNPKDKARMMARQRMLEAGQTAEAAALGLTGTDRVLVVLAEYAGTDVLTWTAPITPTEPATGSQWDPLGIADPNEAVYDADGNLVTGDCSLIITQTKTLTYTGPLHNAMARPLSAADRSGQSIWTPDFTKTWFNNFMFGSGVVISYTRQDASVVNESFLGQSVKQYFSDLSTGTYTITGDVIGWVPVPHSSWWYGADKCPGNRSGATSGGGSDSGIPNAGTTRTLVKDALNAVNAISNTISGFNWANYDKNGDGEIDRLWIVHAGYGEEDGIDLLNRNPTQPSDPTRTTPWPEAFYGEAAVWSHSSAVTPPYSVTQNIAAGPYIMMPENGGIGVFAHEYAHNLGADDLYAYGNGDTSAGFWALQADDWTGYPIGFEPPAPDPWHLDNWGWLSPLVITDTTKVYTVTLGQASYFNTNTAASPVYRGAKIVLPTGLVPLPVPVWQGANYWWGGKLDVSNAMMTTKAPVVLPSGSITLTFDTAYGIETEWDFMWVQVSTNGGTTWKTITNTNTTCTHDSGWIGGLYGFPDDLCAAGLGGFTDYNASFPDPDTETFNLSAYAGQSVLLRFWYMTDWATTYEGPFVDNVLIKAGATTVFSDDAEAGAAKWNYAAPWARSDGTLPFTHNFYLQWRNTNSNGGYDSALGDSRWRFGPANTGLLVWYNNNSKTDNEIFNYLNDYPGYGPKGRMLVVDAHPDPYREPDLVAAGYNNEAGNVTSRSQMRDAPFTLQDTVGFTYTTAYAFPITTTLFTNYFNGRPAVSTFNDAMGYYPGAEFAPGGPVGQTTPRWMTKQWDASVTVPSTEFYGINAPGYTDGTRMRYGCSLNDLGQVLCYGYPSGLGYDGGTGNPGDIDGQYGWHVQVIAEAADHTWAKVKIWNSMQAADQTYAANKTTTSFADTVTYNYVLNQNWGSPLSLFACVPLDTAKVEFVPGSGTNGAVALPMSCAAAANALAGNRSLSALAADAASTVMAVGWTGGNIGTAVGSPGFGFQVKVKVLLGVLHQSVNLYDNGSLWTTLKANDVTVVPAFKVFLPLVRR